MKTAILLCCSFLVLGSLSPALALEGERVGDADPSSILLDTPSYDPTVVPVLEPGTHIEWIWDENVQAWVPIVVPD